MKTLITFAASAIVALGILFLPACGPGNPGDEDGGDGGNEPDGGIITMTVIATAPTGVTVKEFRYANWTVAECKHNPDDCPVSFNEAQEDCTNVNKCTFLISKKKSVTPAVAPKDPKFAFKTYEGIVFEAATMTASIDWNGPGDYGVQVGTVAEARPYAVTPVEYEENEHGNPSVYHMYTAVGESGHVELLGGMWNSATNVILTGYSFEGENDRYSLRGAVSQDLSTIHYHISYVDGTEDDVNLNHR